MRERPFLPVILSRMPTVVPRQIVQFIDATLNDHLGSDRVIEMDPRACGGLNTLLRLLEQVPSALLPSDPQTYVQFVLSQESIRYALEKAKNQDARSDLFRRFSLGPDGSDRKSQVHVIREALAMCPDETTPQLSTALAFIDKADLRAALLMDLEASHSALINGEWKAATVFAGALIEALLLWAIESKPEVDIQRAASAAIAAGNLQKCPADNCLNWVLHEFVEVAEHLKLIEADTAREVRLAKDFRNLIHPGRSKRLGQKCDRGTALLANAALEHVARDLSAKF